MEVLYDLFMKAYPIILGGISTYSVWLLQQQNIQKQKDDEKNEQAQKEETKKRDAERIGTMLLLRYMLKRYHTEYVWQKYITEEQLKDYVELHEAYHALGGNSVAERWYKDILNLPIREAESDLSPYAKAYFKTLNHEE